MSVSAGRGEGNVYIMIRIEPECLVSCLIQ